MPGPAAPAGPPAVRAGAAHPAAAPALGDGGGGTARPPGGIPRLLDNLPTSLGGSRLAEKLQVIVELDLEELQAIETPRGYGRD